MSRVPPRLALLSVAFVAGCAPDSWPLSPAGSQAQGIAGLWWLFSGVAVAVWILVMAALTWAVLRGRRRDASANDRATTRAQARWVGGAVGVSAVALLVLAAVDFAATRRMMAIERRGEDPLTVLVTGHRWWWEVTYEPDEPRRRFRTANEIHVPVGRPVLLRLESRDVIHSLWIPRLQGKRDLVPGYTTTLWIEAEEPGVYGGACAEFCGLSHAEMRLVVVAQPPDRFDRWYADQLTPARSPADSIAARGRDVFMGAACPQCHTVRGTPALGQVAPDLTHFGSRRTIAAGILPNTPANLGGWIVDPRNVKPGAAMPPNPLPGEDLRALIHYLGGLR